MIMRWISLVPSKMVKILKYVQFPLVIGLVDLWYQHGSSTSCSRGRTVSGRPVTGFERGTNVRREGTADLAVAPSAKHSAAGTIRGIFLR
jgi:hypothetical protein